MSIMSYQSIPALLRENARQYARKTAISYKKKGVFLSLTYEKFYERVLMLARGSRKSGMEPIENELKLDKYISQAIVFGDRKPYLVALLTPNIERIITLAREQGISYIDIEELVNNRKIKELFGKRIEALNKNFPPYKTIKYFAIVPREFSIEGGELTPTLKMKRKVIYEKYKALVDDLYEARGNGIIAQQKKQ